MTTFPEDPRPTPYDARPQDKAGPDVQEKEHSKGENVPGWSFMMRPLRRKGGKATETTHAARLDSSNDNGDIGRINGQTDDDRRSAQSKASAYGLEHSETLREVTSEDGLLPEEHQGQVHAAKDGEGNDPQQSSASGESPLASEGPRFKVYKRRWFGVVQLALLNTIVSWDWLSFAANSTTVSQYYGVSPSAVNWLSTAFLFAFVAVSPLVMLTLNRGGPKPSIMTAAVLILLGNWIRYGATRAGPQGNFGGVMFGQLLTGFAQPFVLSAPTRYSDLWFTNRGRIAATAVMSLANPFGGALAQLINPFWAGSPGDIPNMVLYVAIISSVASIPSFFIPAAPPTPSSNSGMTPKEKLLPSLRFLFTSPEFYMIFIPFTIYVGLFNSISSLLNQMLAPYSFSETEAGIAGALLIVVGLVTAAVTSPIIDRTKTYLFAIKIQVPIIAACYLAFTWAPGTRSRGAVFAILAIMGSASFSLVPVVLEYLIEITHPVSPEVTSTICWTGGQLTGGIFILISGALRAGGISDGTADDGSKLPPGNLFRALIFQAVLALAVVSLPLALGCCGRRAGVRMRRVEADNEAGQIREAESNNAA